MEKADNDNNCFIDDADGKGRSDAGNAVSWHAVKLFPDFVNAYPKNRLRIEGRFVDAVS